MLSSVARSFLKHTIASAVATLAPMAAEKPTKTSRVLVAILKQSIESRRIVFDTMYAELTDDDVTFLKRIVTFSQALMEPEVDPEYPPSKGEVSMRTLVAAAKAFGRATNGSSQVAAQEAKP